MCFLFVFSPSSLPLWSTGLISLFHWSFSQTVGLLGRVMSTWRGLYLNRGQHKHRINAYTHRTSIPWVGLEHTIPASERAKTVHGLDHWVTVTGFFCLVYTYVVFRLTLASLRNCSMNMLAAVRELTWLIGQYLY
jgi:hypothetical protein